MVIKNRVNKLNVLRVVAFLMVFMLHAKIFIPVQWNMGMENIAWLFYTPGWAAVWIFVILSGYGIGSGFTSEKYELSRKGIGQFYLKRIYAIVPLYYIYLLFIITFIKPDLLLPSITNLKQLLSLFLFNYHADFLSIEFGLAWYLTLLMRLYFLAPFIAYFIKKIITKRWHITLLLILVVCMGFILRITLAHYIEYMGGNWSANVYVPVYCNLDLFIGGFLVSLYKKYPSMQSNKKQILYKILSPIFLVCLILYNCRIYYDASYNGGTGLDIYCYVLPSVYLVFVSIYIFAFEINKSYQSSALTVESIKKNPLRIFDALAKIQMSLYLFHSTILYVLQLNFIEEQYLVIGNYLGASSENYGFIIGGIFTFIALLITIVFSIVITYLISSSSSKKPLLHKKVL